MSGEDTTLRVELEKLEIEAKRLNATLNEENPFHRRNNAAVLRSSNFWNTKCACSQSRKSDSKTGRKEVRTTTMFKRGSSKMLKDPVLKYIATCQNGSKCEAAAHCVPVAREQDAAPTASLATATVSALTTARTQPFRNDTSSINEDFSSLVNNCDKLRISYEADNRRLFASHSFRSMQEEVVHSTGGGGSIAGSASTSAGPSCSQQALNPPCDITIDELASYFETMVHIPKKMSSMAEMMYI